MSKQKPIQTARPLADPDARGLDIPDHVQRPADPELLNPMGLTESMTAKQGKKDAKRRIKAIKRRLRS